MTTSSRKRKKTTEKLSTSITEALTNEPNTTWSMFYKERLIKSSSDDFTISYYMSGDNIVQADRDYVAQVMTFYARRGKRDNCPPVDGVVLRGEVQGVTNNLASNNPLDVIFKTPKHINAMYNYLQLTRAEHNNVVVHIKVDDSPFFDVM
jgi:hypothetical protein